MRAPGPDTAGALSPSLPTYHRAAGRVQRGPASPPRLRSHPASSGLPHPRRLSRTLMRPLNSKATFSGALPLCAPGVSSSDGVLATISGGGDILGQPRGECLMDRKPSSQCWRMVLERGDCGPRREGGGHPSLHRDPVPMVTPSDRAAKLWPPAILRAL